MTRKKIDPQIAVNALLKRAERARKDPSAFYSAVMRHETTGAALVTSPHQDLAISFIEHHPTSVLRIPIGTGKTYITAALCLYYIGNDKTSRGALVGAAAMQPRKVLSMVQDYIIDPKLNSHLAIVFPWLKPTQRDESWTQKEMVIDRPPGIRDPTLVSIGFDGKIGGSRLSFFCADDLIDDQNTSTPEARDLQQSRFDARLQSRLDPIGGRGVVTNTPWHQEDLTFHLEKEAFWPTLTMDIYGFIRFSNVDAEWIADVLEHKIRPSETREGGTFEWYRLKANDPDPDEETPLWADRYSTERIREIRYGKTGQGGMLPQEFARMFLCQPTSDDAQRCAKAWIEACKIRGLNQRFLTEYSGTNKTITGVDLGIGKKKKHDKTTLFTIEVEPDSSRRILDIESGRFKGPEIITKIIAKTEAFGSVAYVENNAAQDYILQFAREKKKDIVVKAHTTTGANKMDVDFGVESIFGEFENGAWIIPCDDKGKPNREVKKFLDDCEYYQPPPAHTGDHLMAAWIAREGARKSKKKSGRPSAGKRKRTTKFGGY